MLDDLREHADTSPLFDLEDEVTLEELKIATERPFLGMKPAQRFFIAFMLFVTRGGGLLPVPHALLGARERGRRGLLPQP